MTKNNKIIYRLESVKSHHGPWSDKDSEFISKWNITPIQDLYQTDKFPGWQQDFGQIIEDYFDNNPDAFGIPYRIGMHLPCLIFYWFGVNLPLLSKYFAVYKIEVKKYYIGKSNLQCLYYTNDVVSKTLFESFNHNLL